VKVYGWQEQEEHWLAVMRPASLFDLSTLHPLQFDHDFREGTQKAKHILTGLMEPYSYVFNKKFGRDPSDRTLAELLISGWPEKYLERDTEDLKRVGHPVTDQS
jgi:hypothetical protein